MGHCDYRVTRSLSSIVLFRYPTALADSEGVGAVGPDPPPGKSQVAIIFFRHSGTEPLEGRQHGPSCSNFMHPPNKYGPLTGLSESAHELHSPLTLACSLGISIFA